MNGTADTTLVRAGTFAVLGADGGVSGRRGTSPDGLFHRDARHLSRWTLTVDGAEPAVLVPSDGEESARCVLTPRAPGTKPAAYTVFREQAVDAGVLTECLRLVNNRPAPVAAVLSLTVDADFADQFELRSDKRRYEKSGAQRTAASTHAEGVTFTYERGAWLSRTAVCASPPRPPSGP